MTYIDMKRGLENTRKGVKRVRMLSQRVNENVQVNQRLTAMYGKERVQSGGGEYLDPTLAALIRIDEQTENFRDELDETMASIAIGKELIARMPKGQSKDLLINYYLMGWNYQKIAKLQGWKSKSYVWRLLAKALNELYVIVK